MTWKPIEDLPENWQDLVSTELSELAKAWEETYKSLKDKSMVDDFNERLRREWSIETGIIERIYTIDRGTTQLLIEQGIDASLITHGSTNRPVSEVISIIKDQRDALDGLFAFVSRKERLTLHYIRTLHQVLVRHQESTEALDQFGNVGYVQLIKGDWKRMPNNPKRPDGIVHEYCPPEQVQIEMERLIKMHYEHLEQGVSPEVEAAWLHHRFTQIHPFQDGNGRVARCLATLVLIRAGRFPLVVNRDQWVEYISSLEEADFGNLERIVRLFDQIEKRSYLKALQVSEELQQTSEVVVDIINGIAERYQKRQQAKYDRVFSVAEGLHNVARQVLDEYVSIMQQRMNILGLPISVRVSASNDHTVHWYQSDIVYVAKKLGYYANLTRPRLWVRLRIEDQGGISSVNAEIVVSFHYLGRENRGIMVSTAFLNILHAIADDATEEEAATDARPFRETHPLATEGFIITFSDESRAEQRRKEFRAWLDQVITIGLAEWERQL
ncbi:MAG TPA: Fic family protein [Roseiflexaceae bacterium]|nr:Fic family protein [Roseiflexaceae bacterium]